MTACHIFTFLWSSEWLRRHQWPVEGGGVRRSKGWSGESVTQQSPFCSPSDRLCALLLRQDSAQVVNSLPVPSKWWFVQVKKSRYVFIGAGNRGRWPAAPTWKRLQTLSGTSRTISILNVRATPSLHSCNCCYFRRFNAHLCFMAVPNISLSVLKPTFLEILLESHIVMIRVRKTRTQLFHCKQNYYRESFLDKCSLCCRATVVWNRKTMRWPLNPGTGPSTIRYL